MGRSVTSNVFPINQLLLAFISLQFFLLLDATVSTTRGLSIKLIHRDSPESPYYSANTNRTERIRRNVLLAKKAYSLKNPHLNYFNNSKLIRPKVGNNDLMYLLEVGIGTFKSPKSPYLKYFLHMDSGADLTWTQCEDCKKTGHCFLQAPPLYPAKDSRTYRPLPCNKHPLCTPGKCIKDSCAYYLLYGDGAQTLGYLARESFTFNSDRKARGETVRDVVFGCGIYNDGFIESSRTNVVAGNFGLGFGRSSFLSQKKSITQVRFSYCLPPWHSQHNRSTYLRFGSDIPLRKGMTVTPLLTDSDYAAYSIGLRGISVKNKRLDIPPEQFRPRSGGGCIVDSGSSVTTLPSKIYDRLKSTLVKDYFSRNKKELRFGGFELCRYFVRSQSIKDLPSVTFHLENNVDLVLRPEAVFLSEDGGRGMRFFCLGMTRGSRIDRVVLGALQQANTRFVYDTLNRKMYFGPEDCLRDG